MNLQPHWLTEEECKQFKCILDHDGPIFCFDYMWYFYDEVWADLHGPYITKEQAKAACLKYLKTI